MLLDWRSVRTQDYEEFCCCCKNESLFLLPQPTALATGEGENLVLLFICCWTSRTVVYRETDLFFNNEEIHTRGGESILTASPLYRLTASPPHRLELERSRATDRHVSVMGFL